MPKRPRISLVLADVDGTLVTEDKVLTQRAQAAVRRLGGAGIRFAITSGRPPKGMAMLFDELQLKRRSQASTAGCSSNRISRSSNRRRCRQMSPARRSS